MINDWLFLLILAASFLLLFGIAELLYHWLKVPVEWTRKLVHLGTGLLTLLFPLLLENHWSVLLLCGSFALILIASLRFRLLPSINAIERFSVGSLAYPVAVYGCFLIYQEQEVLTYFYLPILTLAICDPIAALTGKKWPLGRYRIGKEYKTAMGSGMFLLTAFCVYMTGALLAHPHASVGLTIWRGLIVASVAMLAEGLSGKGTDNLTIPAAVVSMLYFTDHV